MMLRETKPVPWRLNPAETEQNNNILQQEIAQAGVSLAGIF